MTVDVIDSLVDPVRSSGPLALSCRTAIGDGRDENLYSIITERASGQDVVLGASPLHQGAVARPLHEMADYAPRCLTRQPRSSKDTHYSKAETHERRSSNETQPSSRTHDESSWKPPHSPRASRQCAREHKKQAISKAATLDFNELSACDLGMLKECQDGQWRDDEGEAMKRFGDRLRAVGHAQAEKRGRSPCSEQQSIAAHEISSSQLERRRDSPKEVDPKRPKSSLGGAAVSSEQHLHQQSSAIDRGTAPPGAALASLVRARGAAGKTRTNCM